MLDTTWWQEKLNKERDKSRPPTYEAEEGLDSVEVGEEEDENNRSFR